MQGLPETFCERLRAIVPGGRIDAVMKTFESERCISARVNTLKTTDAHIETRLRDAGVAFEQGPFPHAVLFPSVATRSATYQALVAAGDLYPQNISSMLPILVLDPQPGESILDACAAPGSKTSQMSAVMNNTGTITAVEAIRPRMFKLHAVLTLLGVSNTRVICADARRLRMKPEQFDRILVDAPCSSEGRFHVADPESFAYWKERKIAEMAHKQRGILHSVGRLLKPGGRLVYSTCSFAPEENEAAIDWFLRKNAGFSVEAISLDMVPSYPAVTTWRKKTYGDEVRKTFRVLPDDRWEGFFVASLRKEQ